jgi:transcriptional regulator with XRE-family HTH domain
MLNIAQNTLSYWEGGKTEPNGDALIKLSEIFGVTTDYLLGRTISTHDLAMELAEKQIKDARAHRIIEGLDDEEMDALEKIAEVFKARKKLPPDEQAESSS